MPSHQSVVRRQMTFGYTHEELKLLVAPMAKNGAEAVGSMGTDTPIAVLSERSRLLFDYFQQLFAQVTNPPLDAIREELVTSLACTIGAEGNLLDAQPDACHQIAPPFPILDNDELAKLIHIDDDGDRPEFEATRHLRLLQGRRRRRGAARSAATASARKPPPRSTRARASSCCPTATPARSWRRSRRCCSCRRCTIT